MNTLERVVLGSRLAVLLVATSVVGACGGAGLPASIAAPAASPTVAATPTTAPSSSAAAGGIRFTVAGGSKAIVRVNEQLADRPLPSDAVLTADKATGTFTLLPDGTFAPGSKITVDLTALASDNHLRDGTVQRAVLQTSQFPAATFVPTKTDGLALPLAANGDLSFSVTGAMTIHGVTKDVTFAVTGQKTGSDVEVVATATPALTFEQFGMTQPHVFSVVSIKDEIRLEVDLVASQLP